MNHNDLCTTIDIDFRHEKITIHNYTEQILLRAFGDTNQVYQFLCHLCLFSLL